MTREQRFALGSLAAIAAITAAWWALALWPAPTDGAEWLARTRAVCFGSTDSGLPDAEGWALLVGQPLGMLAVLLAGWRRAAGAALRAVAASRPGRAALAVSIVALLTGAGAAGVRVVDARAAADVLTAPTAGSVPAASLARVDRMPPTALELVDHRGVPFRLDAIRGRPALITFAFAHCETVCPVLVRDVLEARRQSAARGPAPVVVVVTVDPWRDTPARLPHVAGQWELPADAHLLGGGVDAVLEELEAWDVSISRDSLTGDVIHPAVVYVLDPAGRIAFATTGGAAHLAGLLGRL